MQVAITGAAGEVGRVVTEAFDPRERKSLTHSEQEDMDSDLLDATDRAAFVDAVTGVDALVHLAWSTEAQESWDSDTEANIQMTVNAFEAALADGIDRVVIASSGHAFGLYNREDPSEFESMVESPTTTVRPDTPPRPDTFYGVAKVAVEGLCRYYAGRHDLDVCIVRIGWLMDEDELRDTAEGPDDRHRFARAMWLSHRDCRALFRRTVEAQIDESPVIAHGISSNSDRFLSLTETMQRLDYRPEDDAAAVLGE